MSTLPCIACGAELEGVNNGPDYTGNQPYAGTTFVSHGQYGSTIWDPMDGSYIMVNICDLCLRRLAERVIVARSTQPVALEYCGIIGYQDIPYESKPWDPDEVRPFTGRRNLNVAELDALPVDVHIRNLETRSLKEHVAYSKEQGYRRWYGDEGEDDAADA